MTKKELQEVIGENIPPEQRTKLFVRKYVRTNNVENFLIDFYTGITGATYFLDNTKQCKANSGRSFNDLFLLVTTYFPKATSSEIANIVIKLIGRDIISVVNCGEIGGLALHEGGCFYTPERILSEMQYKYDWRDENKKTLTFEMIVELSDYTREEIIDKYFKVELHDYIR